MAKDIYYINDGIFSVYYISTFSENGEIFNCVKQYIVKRKQEMFDPTNHRLAKKIMEGTHTSYLRHYEKMIRNYDEQIWNEQKYDIILDALYLKFTQNSIMRNLLLQTGNKMIADNYTLDENLLGKALVQTRHNMMRIMPYPVRF